MSLIFGCQFIQLAGSLAYTTGLNHVVLIDLLALKKPSILDKIQDVVCVCVCA